MQVSLPSQDHGTAQRIIHDISLVWDGKDPDNQAETYLELLRYWLSITRTLKTEADTTILHYSHGDLKILIKELDVDSLTAPDSGEAVFKLVYKTYKELVNRKLPITME